MWEAIENAITLVKLEGYFFLSLYIKGPRYKDDLKLKYKFNRKNNSGKKIMLKFYILKHMLSRLKSGKNPFAWNEKKARGMNTYYDIIDWLGGLPYEVADENEVINAFFKKGLFLKKIEFSSEGACSIYLFQRKT